jgi:hypothetical protein
VRCPRAFAAATPRVLARLRRRGRRRRTQRRMRYCVVWTSRTPAGRGRRGWRGRPRPVGVLGEQVGRVAEVARLLDNLYDSVARHGCRKSWKRGLGEAEQGRGDRGSTCGDRRLSVRREAGVDLCATDDQHWPPFPGLPVNAVASRPVPRMLRVCVRVCGHGGGENSNDGQAAVVPPMQAPP